MTAQEMVTETVENERKRRGLTHAEMAAMIGVARPTFTNKLLGRRQWGLDDLDRLSAALDVPLAWWLMSTVRTTAATVRVTSG